jgi:hypothetical protein
MARCWNRRCIACVVSLRTCNALTKEIESDLEERALLVDEITQLKQAVTAYRSVLVWGVFRRQST